jgi:ABC-2 type transport system ATP-binding protein
MNVVVEARGLQKRYGDVTTVKGVSFSVQKGEVFGILGPNGAGKTTTLEMIEALRPIDGGSASIDGIDVAKHPDKIKEIIGIQLQSTQFLDRLSLTDLLNMFGGMYSTRVDVKELLDEVQLGDKAKAQVNELSGGQKQRFSIAAALVNQPKVLFLDEPTTGLDPQARRHLWELVQQIKQKGITVVMTTHYMEEAELLCDRVAIMDNGEIVALDTPGKLIDKLLKRGFKKDVIVRQASLEDVFIDLTGKELRES